MPRAAFGYELAKQFATNGFDLIVCAEDDAIATAAREMDGLGARTEAVQANLARRFMPDTAKAAMHRRRAEPGSADDED